MVFVMYGLVLLVILIAVVAAARKDSRLARAAASPAMSHDPKIG